MSRFSTSWSVCLMLTLSLLVQTAYKPPVKPVDYRIQLDVISDGYDSSGFWIHSRAGAIPGPTPVVVMTEQKWKLGGNDVFLPLNELRTADMGKTWTEPVERNALGRRAEPERVVVGISDFWPKWHRKTGRILGTGHTVRYRDDVIVPNSTRQTVWSVYDANTHTWTPWDSMPMPREARFGNAGAGSTQRVDLPNGDILLPVYYKKPTETLMGSTIVRCKFDGKKLTYTGHGDEFTLPRGRGLYEPSLARFRDRYFLTMRNNDSGYVAVGRDGLHFSKPLAWHYDDGRDLGNYNTQQHWVTHSDGLFLVYTRRGANNDHVFRHRAPLFIAQVDPEKLVVIRSTERILIPNKGARLDNFGVTNVSAGETWVTVAEVMAQGGEQYGANGRVYAARIQWAKPNRTWNQY